MRRRAALAAALAASTWMTGVPAAAQPVVTSDGPDAVAVTVYRDREREAGQSLNIGWLQGYALISETRTISVPAGESVVRFEGVASGLFPETAIVTGFPEGIIERNRDADLLSAASLLDRSLARRVHLRRTALATGAVREEEAVIRSGAGGAVVLQTAAGFEALRCSGLPETLIYDEVPAGLSPRPTLSVRLRSAVAATATVTLSYLAAGFDWQANYVATLAPDGRRLDLFAWMTLASMDDTSFRDASAQAVAGQPNRERPAWRPPQVHELQLRCWPEGRTDQAVAVGGQYRGDEQSIVVTGSRIGGAELRAMAPVTSVMAEQEDLGDLKLYRIPVAVTVASHSQKQVALLRRTGVAVRQVYRQRLDPGQAGDAPVPAQWMLLTRNRSAEGLGLPLPAGRLLLFGAGAARPVMLGVGSIRDHAIGEEVELPFGPAIGIFTTLRRLSDNDGVTSWELIVSSDQRRRVAFEAELAFTDVRSRTRLETRGGMSLWRVRLPANGSATLRFTSPGGLD
jgi:hypothetical protein